jgi:hypothetical protein
MGPLVGSYLRSELMICPSRRSLESSASEAQDEAL